MFFLTTTSWKDKSKDFQLFFSIYSDGKVKAIPFIKKEKKVFMGMGIIIDEKNIRVELERQKTIGLSSLNEKQKKVLLYTLQKRDIEVIKSAAQHLSILIKAP